MNSKIYLRFIIYFLLFGLVVSFATFFINSIVQSKNITKEIRKNAQHFVEAQENMSRLYIHHLEQDLYSIINNPLFLDYIKDSSVENLTLVQKLFLNVLMANKAYFQLRFINSQGKEVIRIERQKGNNKAFIVDEKNLQDKSQRYYFKETIKHEHGTYWYSKLDLNVEHEKIEEPYRPTMRISIPVTFKNKSQGLVIINVDMSDLLHLLQTSNEFYVYLVDKEGYFILHPDNKKSWSRYLGTKYTLMNEFVNETPKKFLQNESYQRDNMYSFSLEKVFKNGEDIHLVLRTHDNYLASLHEDSSKLTLYLALLIFFISVPTGIIIAFKPAKIQEALHRTLNENLKKTDIIDKYVLTFTTDTDGRFNTISTALCNLTGYERSELIGEKASIFQSGNTSHETYRKLWDTISSGNAWHGELQDKNKDGDLFWLETTILPLYDEHHIFTGYMSISSDITSKKLYQLISEHDKLTNIYNRHKLDKTLEEEFQRVARYNVELSLIILDIDHFKSVNDTYGHQVGDSVLIELTKLLRTNIRNTDIIGRWGGEEFLIICTNTNLKGAYDLAEHLREKVAAYNFTTVGHKTSSFGVAAYSEGDTIESLLKRADDNLYKAKESGRNKVVST
ncbi:diguanylate cyclase [Sulfurimonas sp. C5]|uniref:sensor domain-containing diguanylate cyclase n=1 Tax=Sulfurimonas sp. C5 TaxID=3036947 RepID=UPI002453D509|nr:diguanylate cyclase [Sulfurimonas sp. C5]MDH4943769.1 diguanylate cyclase [Sulfurimonas sp. C5]